MAGKVSRRTVLLGAGAAGLATTAVGGFALGTRAAVPQQPQLASAAIPFYGPHQPGIATPPPASLSFVALDLTSQSSDDLRSLLRVWTAAISSMMAGEPVTTRPVRGGDPADTSEATGLGPSRLTVTVGFGPRLFAGGLASRRPPALIDLPAFPGDALEPARSDGDLCAQVCADDPQVAYHAVRTLTRLAAGVASPRWVQAGFRQPPGGAMSDATPRNLLGFKDGTDNLKASSEAAMTRHVWAGDGDDPPWMRGGSYLIARRIRTLLDSWDKLTVAEQERTIGRKKQSGAPLGLISESDPVNLNARDATGQPLIPEGSHIRTAIGDGSIRILRRGYNFADGLDAQGTPDVGLFFLTYVRDPRAQFVPLQMRLATHDLLAAALRHTGSAIFACPPGITAGGTLGEGLLS